MTSHTPGPWSIEKTSDGYGVRAPHWGYVAIHHSSSLPHWEEGQAANRLLIAAAPDLLDSLETLLDCFVIDPLSWMNNQSEAIEKARDAIAKATGA